MVCTQVASRLRAGASPAQAWAEELGSGDAGLDLDGVPRALAARVGSSPALDAAVAACRVATRSGAPLAEVLLSCATSIAEAQAAERERERARAGPAMTARILGWLPLASLGLGALLGADPLEVARSGGWGSASVVAGLLCLVLGRGWTRRLVARAGRAS